MSSVDRQAFHEWQRESECGPRRRYPKGLIRRPSSFYQYMSQVAPLEKLEYSTNFTNMGARGVDANWFRGSNTTQICKLPVRRERRCTQNRGSLEANIYFSRFAGKCIIMQQCV